MATKNVIAKYFCPKMYFPQFHSNGLAAMEWLSNERAEGTNERRVFENVLSVYKFGGIHSQAQEQAREL